MQTVTLVTNDSQLDVLNVGDRNAIPRSDLYALGFNQFKDKAGDIMIASAHEPATLMARRGVAKLVVVVSYVPAVTSEAWPAFFTNLCVADVIAGDSYIREQLSAYTYPPKPWINLDGCGFDEQYPRTNTGNINFEVWSADVEPLFWLRFKPVMEQAKLPVVFVSKPTPRTVAIAFQPISPLLATYLQRRVRWLSVAYNPATNHWYDCRQIHRVNVALEKLINMPGTAAAKPIVDEFTTYIEELRTVVEHSHGKEARGFHSNVHFVDRIFHQINAMG